MPCYDHRDDNHTSNYREELLSKERKFLEAIACMLMKHVSDGQLTKQDFKNAGVTREAVDAWWNKHRAADAERIAREKEAARIEKIRISAINKLTKDEREALGL